MVIVPPSDSSYGRGDPMTANQTTRSFFLVGPADFPDMTPVPTASTVAGNFMGPMANDGMEYYVPANLITGVQALMGAAALKATPSIGGVPNPTLLLRRLACPLLKPNPTGDPMIGPFNPYITVDYLEDLPLNNALATADIVTNPIPMASLTKREQRYSYGRRQPLKGNLAYLTKQVVDPAAMMPFMDVKNQHTFNRHNGVTSDFTVPPAASDALLEMPFEWYTHLDRTVISTPELFTVSSLRPHELTQDFFREDAAKTPTLVNHGHLADWRSDDQRLWRSLSLLTTRPRTAWMGKEGKIPGQININTMEAGQVWNAIADAQTINHFSAADVTNAFTAIDNQRSATNNAVYRPRTPILPAGTPITPPSDPQYPSYTGAPGVGIADTILNPAAGFMPVSNNPTAHPYIKNEMLIKTYNQLTTKSNCFAVWMTIGYFEVKNDGPYTESNRPILGAEIGSDTGTTQRNRFFSVIDRSGLALDLNHAVNGKQGPPLVFFNHEDDETLVAPAVSREVITSVPATSSDLTNIPNSVSGSYDGLGWKVSVGDKLYVDVGSSQEEVTVTRVFAPPTANPAPATGSGPFNATANTYRIGYNVTGTHRPGFSIRNLRIGNPGPQPAFDFASPTYGGVVRYTIQTQ